MVAALGAAVVCGAPAASVRGAEPEEGDVDGATATASGPASVSPARFRGGFSGSVGGLLHGDFALGVGGMEGRLGAQITDPFAVYVQPFFGVYWGTINGVDGDSLMGGASALVDYTFGDRAFVAGGVGVARFDEPIGATLHLRGGVYPAVGFGDDGIGRRGLMVGGELRLFIVSETVVASPTVTVGFEAF